MFHTLGCHDFNTGFDGVYLLAKGAGMLAVPASLIIFGWVRQARQEKLVHARRARGECTVCGYPLGVHDKCTECGAAVDRTV